jgi:NAD(P)-dependent dehydrogenase (short-subunit alcohol dehydrogenase family)
MERTGEMKNFDGKIAFITGGASGAGLGQAKLFSKAGMKIVITDIRKAALDKAVPEILAFSGAEASNVLALEFDLTDRTAYAAAADKTEEVFGGPPHLLIQTAGVNSFGPPEASTFEDYDWVMGVCLNAVVNGLVIFVPRMIRAYAGKTDCHIATTSSWAGWMGDPAAAPYAASKAAVNNLSETYYFALKPYGIGVTTICPMAVNSEIYDAEKYRPEKLRNSGYYWTDEIAAVMREHCESGMDPVTLAECLKRGIEEEQLFVIPYPNYYEMVSKIHERRLNFTSPEGMIKDAAAEKYHAEQNVNDRDTEILKEKGEPLGFGAARADLDWVDDSKKR